MTPRSMIAASVVAAVGAALYLFEYRLNVSLRGEVDAAQIQIKAFEAERSRGEQSDRENSASADQLRSQLEEIARLRAEVSKLRRELADRREVQSQRINRIAVSGNANIPSPEEEFRAANEMQRDHMQGAATAIAAFIANNPNGKFSINGNINPDLKLLGPNVPWETVELAFADVESLRGALEADPKTVVARSRTTIQDANGGSLRWYTFADGSVDVRLHQSDQETVVPLLMKK